jgi:hypothetical protein
MAGPPERTVTGMAPSEPAVQRVAFYTQTYSAVRAARQFMQVGGCATCRAVDYPTNCKGSIDPAFGANCVGYFR